MNKQEIQRRIESHKNSIQLSTEIVANLEKQLGEAEKPELGHGDFGITERGSFVAINIKEPIRKPPRDTAPFYKDGFSDGTEYTKKHPEDYNIFGNIFSLLNEWSKDFEEFEIKSSKYNSELVLKLKSNDEYGKSHPYGTTPETIIWIEQGGKGGYFSPEEIKEIWMALGQAIFELKRKQNK